MQRKRFYLCSLLLLTNFAATPVEAQIANGTPIPRLQPEYAITDKSMSPALNRIYKIEVNFFGQAYDKDNMHQRISRLENNVFGSTSYDALNDRLERLERALGKGTQLKIENPKTSVTVKKSKSISPVKETPDKKFADLLNKAQAEISMKRYHAAAEELMNAIQMNPSSSLAFRQLGDVLVQLKDPEGAQEAYKACFENDPFGENGRYAKSKLLGLVFRTAKNKKSPQDTPPVINNTINTMNRQVTDYNGRMRADGIRNANWKLYSANLETNRIMRETNQWAMDARNGYGGGYGGGLPFGQRGFNSLGWRSRGGGARSNDRYNSREISNIGYIRSNWVRTDGRVQSYAALREAAERSRHFTESATNLKDQLARPPKKGQASLRALGTNVYVRYYGDETPSSPDDKIPEDPALELKATPEKLNQKQTGVKP